MIWFISRQRKERLKEWEEFSRRENVKARFEKLDIPKQPLRSVWGDLLAYVEERLAEDKAIREKIKKEWGNMYCFPNDPFSLTKYLLDALRGHNIKADESARKERLMDKAKALVEELMK